MIRKNIFVLLILSLFTFYLYSTEPTAPLEVNEDGVVNIDVKLKNSNGNTYDPLPVGTILMFSGQEWEDDKIPGWKACTAINNSTDANIPNLEDTFIRGGSTTDVNDKTIAEKKGGNNSITLSVAQMPKHSHSLTITSDGEHTHSYTDLHLPSLNSKRGQGSVRMINSNPLSTEYKTTGSAGAHNHPGSSIGEAGGNEAIDIRPSYYTVIYIIKVSN